MGQHHTVWELLALGSIAGVIPVYLGIGAAFLVLKLLNRSWEGFLTGISTGILVYLFFDLMHEAVELTGATNQRRRPHGIPRRRTDVSGDRDQWIRGPPLLLHHLLRVGGRLPSVCDLLPGHNLLHGDPPHADCDRRFHRCEPDVSHRHG